MLYCYCMPVLQMKNYYTSPKRAKAGNKKKASTTSIKERPPWAFDAVKQQQEEERTNYNDNIRHISC